MATRTVLSSGDIGRALTRISHEIIESNHGTTDLIILGIPTRGVVLANRIATIIHKHYPEFEPTRAIGRLDITMFRDDLASQPNRAVTETVLPVGGIEGKVVILVDDVLFSGRTARAALDALSELGRPNVVRLAVLIDRGHRELPIRADFVGKNLPTSRQEHISLNLSELDTEDSVVID